MVEELKAVEMDAVMESMVRRMRHSWRACENILCASHPSTCLLPGAPCLVAPAGGSRCCAAQRRAARPHRQPIPPAGAPAGGRE